MRNIKLRISDAMKRLADSYYQKRADEIDRSYSHIKVNPLTYPMMRSSDKEHYMRIYINWAEEKVQARFETYRDAFRKEGIIPDDSDLSEMSWAFDEIIANLSPDIPDEAQMILNQVGQRIIKDARRDIQILINEMKYEQLEAKKPDQTSSVHYTTHIYGDNRGNLQQGGSGNIQNIHRRDNETK